MQDMIVVFLGLLGSAASMPDKNQDAQMAMDSNNNVLATLNRMSASEKFQDHFLFFIWSDIRTEEDQDKFKQCLIKGLQSGAASEHKKAYDVKYDLSDEPLVSVMPGLNRLMLTVRALENVELIANSVKHTIGNLTEGFHEGVIRGKNDANKEHLNSLRNRTWIELYNAVTKKCRGPDTGYKFPWKAYFGKVCLEACDTFIPGSGDPTSARSNETISTWMDQVPHQNNTWWLSEANQYINSISCLPGQDSCTLQQQANVDYQNGLTEVVSDCLVEKNFSCTEGYHLEQNKCKENKCTCENGTGAEEVFCETHGSEDCEYCNSGYKLKGGRLFSSESNSVGRCVKRKSWFG